MTTAEIIDQVLTPLTECLTPEAAKRIVDFEPGAATREAVNTLAAKANAGTLTAEEKMAPQRNKWVRSSSFTEVQLSPLESEQQSL